MNSQISDIRYQISARPKVALVYDRVNTPHGGAEKVLLALHQLYPNAPLYTSVYDAKRAKWAKVFKIKTSFLQKIPFAKNHHRYLAWLMPLAFETLDLSEYDLIISVTSAEAKGIITRANQLHICYLLTPTRYLYSHKQNYLGSLPKIPLLSNLATCLLNHLKNWDQIAAHRSDVIIPISNLVKKRAKQYYGVETERVIYPAVSQTSNIQYPISKQLQNSKYQIPKNYYLVISRLVSYKRIDLAIKACQKLNKKLIIVGQGPELNKLKKLARNSKFQMPNAKPISNIKYPISFLNSIPKKQIINLLQNCKGLLMPGLEDFGITALETANQNVPVIIHEKSGVAEILKNYPKAIFTKSESVLNLINAIKKSESKKIQNNQGFENKTIYNTSYFLKEFSSTIERLYANHKTQTSNFS
ncbi:MAG: glycosyltransferase [Patescibacteria group bacterium]